METKFLGRDSLEREISGDLARLFDAMLQFTSDVPADALFQADEGDGAYIGSGDGTVRGERVSGTIRWSLYAGDCLYPFIRRGEAVPDERHLCTLRPGGFIDTLDGARIRFDGRGYGLRTRDWYRLSATLVFGTDAPQYEWLTDVLAVMEGDFDEKAGRAVWNVFVPSLTSR
jgi:hypothetical protein